jgi:N-acetylmuramoyl-L-alanine amidase
MKVIFLLLITFFTLQSQENYLSVEAQSGDGLNVLLRRYNLKSTSSNKQKFVELNQNNLTKNYGLKLGVEYKLPIILVKFDGSTIRSSIGNNDYDYALAIQNYNDTLYSAGIKKEDFRKDLELWVPEFEFYKSSKIKVKRKPTLETRNFPILGKSHQSFKEISKKLSGSTFYLVSGHGGPDPGAMAKKNGNWLSEDEYAYDVILRLGKELAKHGATIYYIVQDPNDGIRDDQILKNSKLEFYYNGNEIELDQRTRLQQRCDIINHLYNKNENNSKNHHVVSIHIDSRAKKQIDIFFYHANGSENGKASAEVLLSTIKEKYAAAQPGRGYEGSISSRNLYILNHTTPVVTFIELGNIQHKRDQQRILVPDNRQAVANWLSDGFLKLYGD